jgi:hypothetical protein
VEDVDRPHRGGHEGEGRGPVALHRGTDELLEEVPALGDVAPERGGVVLDQRDVLPAVQRDLVAGRGDLGDEIGLRAGDLTDHEERRADASLPEMGEHRARGVGVAELGGLVGPVVSRSR